MKYHPLTPEMALALQTFANRYGEGWKDRLALLWAIGGDDSQPHGSYLRRVRNQYGPRWLARHCIIAPQQEY
jgi:hypothetical protein